MRFTVSRCETVVVSEPLMLVYRYASNIASLLLRRELVQTRTGLVNEHKVLQASLDSWVEEGFLKHASSQYIRLLTKSDDGFEASKSTIAVGFSCDARKVATTQ